MLPGVAKDTAQQFRCAVDNGGLARERRVRGDESDHLDDAGDAVQVADDALDRGQGDLDRSIAFYTELLGMKLLRRQDYPEGKFTLAFVGYTDEADGAVIELTHNWDTPSYDLGTGFGHLAVEVEDAYAACEKIKAQGGTVVREAGPMKHGTTVIAFVTDPDGYKIEFIQKKK